MVQTQAKEPPPPLTVTSVSSRIDSLAHFWKRDGRSSGPKHCFWNHGKPMRKWSQERHSECWSAADCGRESEKWRHSPSKLRCLPPWSWDSDHQSASIGWTWGPFAPRRTAECTHWAVGRTCTLWRGTTAGQLGWGRRKDSRPQDWIQDRRQSRCYWGLWQTPLSRTITTFVDIQVVEKEKQECDLGWLG